MDLKVAIAIACFAVALTHAEREPGGLPQSAPDADIKYKPATDYDKDSCYPTPAIGPSGTINPGKELGGDVNGECHDEVDLDDANIYSRSKCNNGWCAYLYAYYFEKDQVSAGGPGSAGHKHDWEHIVVWVADDQPDEPAWVAVSQHGGWFWRPRDQIQWEGTHAKVVYHKDGGSTHDFRFATTGDEPPENDKGTWQLPKVIGWDNFPPGFHDSLVSADWGHAKLELKNENFDAALSNSKPSEVPLDPFIPGGNGYAPGRCGMHVTQYQKPNPATDAYALEVRIYDQNQDLIGGTDGKVGPSVSLPSRLPYTMEIHTGAVDANPVTFAYASQSWDSNDASRCSVGAYDSGQREMDCGFTCD